MLYKETIHHNPQNVLVSIPNLINNLFLNSISNRNENITYTQVYDGLIRSPVPSDEGTINFNLICLVNLKETNNINIVHTSQETVKSQKTLNALDFESFT